MAETVAERRVKLAQAKTIIEELIAINERAGQLETDLSAAGVSDAEVVNTMDKLLTAGGPPLTGSSVALVECTGDTTTDRLVNLTNSNVSGGVDWSAEISA